MTPVEPEALTRAPTLPNGVRHLRYTALTTSFEIESNSLDALQAVDFQYGHMRAPPQESSATVGVKVNVREGAEPGSFELTVGNNPGVEVPGIGHLLHELDNQLSHALQHVVPGLYFVHSACLAKGDSGSMIMGDSGAGKSTTAYALATRGLRYLSDELSPIDPENRKVLPYPRALCLKNDPPAPLELPRDCLRSDWTLHVQPTALGADVTLEPAELHRIVFLCHAPDRERARLKRMSSSEAAMRLYQNALNQLAHSADGLDEAIAFVSGAECFQLERGGVEDTLDALAEANVL